MIKEIDKYQQIDVLKILAEEIEDLKRYQEESNKENDNKRVIKSEESLYKTRFYLKDGSTYVCTKKPTKNYKYLYDAKTKTVTYEFENGQVERTFECGLKEIRTPDGKIFIKTQNEEYEAVNKQ